MTAHSLVFGVGDRVSGSGRMVADADGEWLDLARTVTAVYLTARRPRSDRSVRLLGADFAAVPTEFGPNNAVPEMSTITGIWLGDAIRVEHQSPDGPARETPPRRSAPSIVASRWTRAQRDEVRTHLIARWDDWAIDSIGERADDDAQPFIEVELVRVTVDLAAWASTLADGLLVLRPSLTHA